MKLERLLEKIDYKLLKGNLDVCVKDIAYDSRCVKNDDVFVSEGNGMLGNIYGTQSDILFVTPTLSSN